MPALVTISSKRQITLPAKVFEALRLRPGGKLIVELSGNKAILIPAPDSLTEYLCGSLAGTYGRTREEIDEYLAQERSSW